MLHIDTSFDSDGNNKLHHIMKESSNYESIYRALDEYSHKSPRKMRKMAGCCNNQGKLPIQLIPNFDEKNEKDEKYKPAIYQIMLNATPSKARPLNEYLNWKEVCQKYQIDPDSRLGKNVKLGCEAVNKAREKIYFSTTHPDAMKYRREDFASLTRDIDYNRNEYRKKICHYVLLSDDIQFAISHQPEQVTWTLKTVLSPEQLINMIQIRISVFEKNNRGNCSEFSDFIEDYLNGKANTKASSIIKGDHKFNEIDPEDKENAVIVDGWSGEVSPKFRLDKKSGEYVPYKKLRYFYPYQYQNRYYMFTPRYNPNYHKVEDIFYPTMFDRTLKRDESDLTKYAYMLMDKLDDKEKFVLVWFILPILKDMLKRKRIDMSEIRDLRDPAKTLIPLFMDTLTRQLLVNEMKTINQLENRMIWQQGLDQDDNVEPQSTCFLF